MKVCTDACLFGAWVADKFKNDSSVKNVLDIGAGTGLLSLMLAQQLDASIEAVELDDNAAAQAWQNFAASPWKNNVRGFNTGIERFMPAKKYDLIISNPPFFEDDLKSADEQRNAAMHSTTLTLEILLLQIKRLLDADGKAAVLVPYHRHEFFERLLQSNEFFTEHVMHVKQSEQHDFFRSQYIFSKNIANTQTHSIAIHNRERQYAVEFYSLLKDYYLKL